MMMMKVVMAAVLLPSLLPLISPRYLMAGQDNKWKRALKSQCYTSESCYQRQKNVADRIYPINEIQYPCKNCNDITTWLPAGEKRPRGRWKKRWTFNIKGYMCCWDTTWLQASALAKDRKRWKSMVSSCHKLT